MLRVGVNFLVLPACWTGAKQALEAKEIPQARKYWFFQLEVGPVSSEVVQGQETMTAQQQHAILIQSDSLKVTSSSGS